jgi:hypothetical protein
MLSGTLVTMVEGEGEKVEFIGKALPGVFKEQETGRCQEASWKEGRGDRTG